ncbi:uncharacterized protein LOC117103867 [Anneissia japonica]|uniref:uncharacterized protein LOC117103867 n=1 Tax=Anneissia japonica TaxID=1529436 RepID=UPI001425ADA9|nr:uncharacterized protein LOC117103867 [Anneissia japonica]
MDYITTKAKYHLPPNTTFTTEIVIKMKIEKFLNIFTTDKCFNKTVYSNVMMKKNGCATFHIYEDGYHVTMTKVGKNTPCASQPDEGVLCFSNINVQDQTTKAMHEMSTTLYDYKTPTISNSVTNSVTQHVTNTPQVTSLPQLEPSTTKSFPVTALASNTKMELVATINSCWPEVVPYIERVAQTDECYEDEISDKISCFKFEDDTQNCGSDWTEAVIQSKKDIDYITTKAKYHLPPNSTFTTKIVINMKIEKFLNIFTTDTCFNKTVYSNVMMKRNGCATFNIYEHGYQVTMTKVGKNTPCGIMSDEGVLCFSNINVWDQTTRAMNEMTTLFDYKTSSISDSMANSVTNFVQITNSPQLEQSTTELFPVTALASNTKIELVATINSCWPKVVPYIERVAQTGECYEDKTSDKISCFKFEDDTQNCGGDWTEAVIQSKKDMDYIITKAKYHLPPNSTFKTKFVISMKIEKFLNRFTTNTCFNKTVYSNVMMKRNGCATFNIYEDGYQVTMTKVGKNTPCASQPEEGVLCFSNINVQDQTTSAMNEMTTTLYDYKKSSVSDSSQLEPSTTEPFPVTMVIIIGSVCTFVVILLSFGCFCFGRHKERKTSKQESGKREIHDDVVLIPMQPGICNTTYDMEPEPLYTTIMDSSAYTALMRSRSETALNVGGGLLLPQTGSLQRLVGSKGSTGTCRSYQHKINLGDITRTSGARTCLDSPVQDADYVNNIKLVSGSKTAMKADTNSTKFASYNDDGINTFDEGRNINDIEAVKDKRTTITTGQVDAHKTGSNYEKCGGLTDKDGYLALNVDTIRTGDDDIYLQPDFCGDTSSMTDIH